MALTRLIGLITSSIIFLSILTGHHFVFPAHITSTPPTNDSSEYVVISADDYVPGLHDYHGDPCTGAALYEGDIALPLIINPDTNTSYILLPPSYSTEERAKRGAISNSNQLWPNAIVYYTFDSSIIDSVKLQIYESMHHWEELTCIRFRVRTTERDYIEFFKGAGCCSYVGNLRGGRQKISIGQYCKSLSIITHEIGHVIGFWHEMNRPDRDEHVRIVTSNIPAYYLFNFRKLPQYYINSRGFVYDYNSVMHYYPKAFTKNSEDTIEPIQEGIPIGPENGLTELDANQTKAMYNCQQYGDRGSTVPSSATPPPEQSFSPNCGSHLMGFSGAFSFDAAKNGRSLCEWLIKAPIGYSIRLVIDMVLPGRTGSCTNGVEVIDGHQLQGRPHGKYCGNFRGYIFLSTYNYMLVKMHVGNRALGGRFTARFSTEDVDECSRYYDSICANGCQNTPGGFTCICEDGYYVSRNKIRCFDINECAYDNGGCSHKCVNTGGSYICNCNQGYALSGDKKTCFIGTAEEQCRNNNGNCEHNCVVSGNTYSCSCNAGYSLYTDNRRCIDVNECSSNPCPDSFECVNNLGSYMCSCPTGFVQSGDECVDINECNQGTHLCSQTCFNSIGSYRCGCNAGYQLSSATACEDFNECSSPSTNTCSDREKCLNLRGAYYCYCRTGFLLSDSNACVDVDECLRGLCDHKCENTVGAYICSCDSGFSLYRDHRSCSKSGCVAGTSGCRCIYSGNSCNCLDGYKLGNAGVFCQDIDECEVNNGGCSHTCSNTHGSSQCSCPSGLELSWNAKSCIQIATCSEFNGGCEQICEETTTPGVRCLCRNDYVLSEDRKSCEDINECAYDNGGCSHKCVNTGGSYICSCNQGYVLNGDKKTCFIGTAEDQCRNNNGNCEHNCVVSGNTYSCSCNAGYSLHTDNRRCIDVNECSSNPCPDSFECVNNLGSYTCSCPTGFVQSGDECVDINECNQGTHLCSQTCFNSIGSYRCGCNAGYQLSSATACEDFNECSSPSTNTCSDREKCLNLRGGYYCYCRTGFLLSDSNACVDVDECLRGLCDHKCENTVGAYICSCDSGFSLYRDRRSCSKSGCVAGTSGCRCIYSGNSCNCLDGYKLGNAGVFCQDIDECEVNNGGCSHTCSNTHGSSQCSCPSGLELSWNAKSCIPTCSEFNGGCEQICEETTTPGVRCLCREDYVLSEDRKSCEVRTACHANGGCHHICTEEDGRAQCSCRSNYQLAADQTSCSRNFNCTDSRICGHFCDTSTSTCACKEGFGLGSNGRTCEDIDECAFPHLSNCSSSCVNTDGSYICICPQGYWIGSDGKTCRENSLGCGGNAFSSSYGSLPKITGPYPIQCVWSITVPQNELAVFRIYYLTFGSPNSCTGFSVEAWDTRAPNNTQVGKQCIGAYEVYFSAAGNTLEIRIDVERDYDPYYEFFYFGVNNNNIFGSSICDQSISLGRNFSSPNFPLSYSSNSDCSIYITSQITPFYVKFYFLNLEWSEDCERDSITIRDVHNYNTRPLAKLCGNRVPEPIRSETIHFSLVFQSDSSVQRGGFYATTYID